MKWVGEIFLVAGLVGGFVGVGIQNNSVALGGLTAGMAGGYYSLRRLSQTPGGLGESINATRRDIETLSLKLEEFNSGIQQSVSQLLSSLNSLEISVSNLQQNLSESLGQLTTIVSNIQQITVRDFEKAPELHKILETPDMDSFRKRLESLFAGIPYYWYTKNNMANYEGHYASVIYGFLRGAGFQQLIPEDTTNRGRVDLTIVHGSRVYVMEIKVGEGGPEALQHIKDKKYYEKSLGGRSRVYIVGVYFSKDRRNIVDFKWERVQ